VLIDCSGSANVLSVAALAAADRALVVAQPTLKQLEGLPALAQTITKVASLYNTALKLSAVIPRIVPAVLVRTALRRRAHPAAGCARSW
jgi:chromosome partitioning protein